MSQSAQQEHVSEIPDDSVSWKVPQVWLWHVSNLASVAVLVAAAQRSPFINVREFKAATNFPEQRLIINRGLRKVISEHNMLQCGTS
jgi:hypothetical protein